MFETVAARESILYWLRRAAKTPPGAFVELGVYHGGSAWPMYKLAQGQKRDVFLFDTFDGMPFQDSCDVHKVGDFKCTNLAAQIDMMPRAHFCVGTFPDSMRNTGPIAFAHIDADQYRSIRDAILYFGPYMVKGGLMCFDDYGRLSGANAAVDQWAPQRIICNDGRAMVEY